MAKKWHFTSRQRLLKELRTNPKAGLSQEEAGRRLAKLGANILITAPSVSPWIIFISQFQDFLVLVLLGTTVVSLFLGETLDAATILAIVFLNSVLGFAQEYRAERSLEALRKLTSPHTKVLREGHKTLLASEELVPGDIVYLEAGDRVPADALLLESHSLSVDESNLTGESLPAAKDENWQGAAHTSLGDLKNIVFKSTLVTRGYAKALVAATGMDTEIGEIAHLLQEKRPAETPLQKRLAQLGKVLVLACLAIVGLVFLAGVKQGFPVYKMFMVGVTLAVAAIPEGLPAVVTIALSVGVQRMSKRNAIIRQLPAVESLGCATVICADKTGTLTQNQMRVERLWIPPDRLLFPGEEKIQLGRSRNDAIFYTVAAGALCTKAEAYQGTDLFGDPTEVALLRLALESGLSQVDLKKEYKEVHALPFDPERKRMSVVIRVGPEYYSLVKGAPDVIMQRCAKVLAGTKPVAFDQERRWRAANALENMARGALRVLAVAYRPLGPRVPRESDWEQNLIFTGLVGMMDPPRPEVPAAVNAARRG
ncbi:MAG: HAD-IC family P-type ATPase, partial [Firmicutes bacterium]|nr:HAD-IC family P-type ATPase [Bacillota bacterium]